MKLVSASCILVIFVISGCFCGVIQQHKGRSQQIELFECTPGVTYIQNQCNVCYCIGDDDFACTIHKCNANKVEELENCATGTVWQERCNKCWCTNAGTVCTNYKCDT